MKRYGAFILLAIIAGCVAGNRAGLQVNPKGQESGRDSRAGTAEAGRDIRGGTVELTANPAQQNPTTQSATATSAHGPAVSESAHTGGQNTNSGAFILQYAPQIAGGLGGVFMWLLFRHLSDKLTRKCEVEMERLAVDREKYTLSAFAAAHGHSIPEPEPTATNVKPVK